MYFYFIMTGHAVFPDIVDGTDGWQEKVVDRFAKQAVSTGLSRL